MQVSNKRSWNLKRMQRVTRIKANDAKTSAYQHMTFFQEQRLEVKLRKYMSACVWQLMGNITVQVKYLLLTEH